MTKDTVAFATAKTAFRLCLHWALRRGRQYGTIFVDLATHRVIDVVPERNAETVQGWLQDHPGVEVIARDRSSEYRRGASAGAPTALQVADRWHLLHNLSQMLKRLFTSWPDRPTLTTCQTGCRSTRPATACKTVAFARPHVERRVSEQRRARQLAVYQQVRHLYTEDKLGLLTIARQLGLDRKTVRRYAYSPTFPERKIRAGDPSALDPYLPYLQQRLDEGVTNASQLWRELQQRDYSGSRKSVLLWVSERRTTPAPTTPGRYRQTTMEKARYHAQRRQAARQAAPSTLAWLATKAPETLCPCEQPVMAWFRATPTLAALYDLAQAFVNMVRQRDAASLDRWLSDANAHSFKMLRTFADGLRADYDAVRAALSTPWSNGPVEGHIHRLKLIKRQMYGRANFDLLRARVLHAN